MGICSEQEYRFWMYIHHELGDEDRQLWEDHLTLCHKCRQEKELAVRMLARVRETLEPKPISDNALNLLMDKLKSGQTAHIHPFGFNFHRRLSRLLIPMAAAACFILVLFGYFRLVSFTPTVDNPNTPIAGVSDQLKPDDLEIIENFEMLIDFDTVQELVNIMRDQDTSTNTGGNVHGKLKSEGNLIYG